MKNYVYVRKSVTWEGRRYEVRGKTEEEARAKLDALLDSLRRKSGLLGEDTTVDCWFDRWKEIYKAPTGITPKSLGLYDEKYGRYIRPAIGSRTLGEVRDYDLQAILNSQAGMSYSHLTKLRMVMQEIFRQARRSQLIPYDPAEGLILPETSRGSRRSITDKERKHLLAVAKDHPAGLWVLTILYAGLRPGETAPLLWADIDFDRNEIHVYKAVESGSRTVKRPKTEAGTRDIPMRQELRERMWAVRGAMDEPVFPDARGKIPSANSLRRRWKAFAKALDIHMGAKVVDGEIVRSVLSPDLTPYCLRHTFCTDLQRAGVPINVAKELMGHANISVTANIYTHRDQKVLHSNIAKLDGRKRKT